MAELIVGQVVSLSAGAADQLVSCGEGDAALLCLALLRHGTPEQARKALRWNDDRADRAWAVLARLGLVAGEKAPETKPQRLEPEGPPDYLRADILAAMEEGSFQSLYHAVERRLGKKLSDTELKSLYEIYDFLALPAEVILLLITWCTEQMQEKYGPGKMPKMPMIKKTAYAWQRMGVDTAEAAEDYLRKQSRLMQREREILPLMGIVGRFPTERERENISAWVEMGFSDDAIGSAYEKAVEQRKPVLQYMNGILKNWHAKGLHTAAEVRAEQSESNRKKPAPNAVSADAYNRDADDRLRRDIERLARYARENERG